MIRFLFKHKYLIGYSLLFALFFYAAADMFVNSKDISNFKSVCIVSLVVLLFKERTKVEDKTDLGSLYEKVNKGDFINENLVLNYNYLPKPKDSVGKTYTCLESVGSNFTPLYNYRKGNYYSDGANWIFLIN